MTKYPLCAIYYTLILFLLINIIGCESFVRKFTRKPKKDSLAVEEMVLVPEEYKAPEMSPEEEYRQYFLYWKSWHDELIVSLSEKKSTKKKVDCALEAVENLVGLKGLLKPEAGQRLDIYIGQLKDLEQRISGDLYAGGGVNYVFTAERIRRNILKNFSYPNIAKDVIK